MKRQFYVYIMASQSYTLYVGVTGDLAHRVYEHKHKLLPGFTRKYNINRLVYYECYESPNDAITREKQLKGLLRQKKIALVEAENPEWRDLSLDWEEGNN